MRRTGFVLLSAAAAILAVLALWKVPQWQTAEWRAFLAPRELLDLQNQVGQTLAILLAASERAALDAIRLAEDTQRRERFTRAVGQLADDRLEVRLGAIYALEQVAGESRQQHQPAMEVLCAYLRERAAWNPDLPPAPRLPTDAQAVLTVLGRRPAAHEEGTSFRLDLRRTDLRGADLNGVSLERANLFEAHLETATMQAARLAHADLRGAWLNNADLAEADLRGADLREAHLDGTYMVEAASRAPTSAALISTAPTCTRPISRARRCTRRAWSAPSACIATSASASTAPPRRTTGHRRSQPRARPRRARRCSAERGGSTE